MSSKPRSYTLLSLKHDTSTMSSPFASSSSRCEDLAHPNIKVFLLSLFIVVGILISYLPQHFRIIARRSSEGLSPWFVLLGTTSSTFALFNIRCLPITLTDISCCHVNSRFSCVAGLLGVLQVFVQWSCFAMM
jgi:hypothetical protein